jgi:hypothetical protein
MLHMVFDKYDELEVMGGVGRKVFSMMISGDFNKQN